MSDAATLHHIRTFLQAAVGLRIMELAAYGPLETWEFEREKKRLNKALASGGDDFQFSGGRKGSGGAYAAALAESIAFMAFAPGGVTVFGDHYEAHYEQETASS